MVGLCALGVALSTSIFAVVHSVLLNPLPYPSAERLVTPWCVAESFGIDRYPFSWENYRDYRDEIDAFAELAAWRTVAMTLEGTSRPTSVSGVRVTANLFSVLGVEPILGRLFEQDVASAPEKGVAVLSHGLWRRVFAGDEDVVGRTIRLDGDPHAIIGVLPPHHRYPASDSEVFVPLSITEAPETERAFHFLRLVGRLSPDASLESAGVEMKTLAANLAQTYPDANANLSARVIPLKDEIIGTSARSLGTVFYAVQILFVVAWVNVAILLLVRGLARRGELELRRALGATRVRLFALLVGEAGMLAVLGCLLGLGGGWLAVESLKQLETSLLPRAYEVGFSPTLILWAAGVSLAAVVVFGSLPAWAATGSSHAHLATTRTSSRLTGSLSTRLVAVQVALAIPLLVASSMQLRSLRGLMNVDTGFAVENSIVAGVALPINQFGPEEQKSYIDRAIETLEAVPGVTSAAAMSHAPLSRRAASIVTYRPEQDGESGLPNAHYRVVSHGMLRTLGIPLLSGREIEPRDRGGDRPVVIVDETLARALFPDRDAVGQKVRLGSLPTRWEIIGVARSAQLVSLDREPEYTVFVPILQNAFPTALSTPKFVVRTEGAPEALTPAVRDALQNVDPNQAVLGVRPLEGQLDDWLSDRRAVASLLWVVAAAALVLAGAGIYATLAFTVGRRLREMAIRAALGAQSTRLARTVVVDGLKPGVVGILAGLGLGVVVGRLFFGMLYNVPSVDVRSLGFAAALMLLAMVLACIAPTRRALRESPTRLLREETPG